MAELHEAASREIEEEEKKRKRRAAISEASKSQDGGIGLDKGSKATVYTGVDQSKLAAGVSASDLNDPNALAGDSKGSPLPREGSTV